MADPKLLGAPINFLKTFFNSSSLRKVDKRKTTENWKKIMMEMTVTNVIDSQPPEQRPTATPNTHAKKSISGQMIIPFEKKTLLLIPKRLCLHHVSVSVSLTAS